MDENIKKIIEGIKKFARFDVNECKGMDESKLAFIESKFMKNSKFPKALRAFLLIGSEKFLGIREPVSRMCWECYFDFYDSSMSSQYLRDRIHKCLGLSESEYAVVEYYGEGDFVSIVRLCDGDDPQVYFSVYDSDLEDIPIFEIVAPSFTDWFISRVVASQKVIK